MVRYVRKVKTVREEMDVVGFGVGTFEKKIRGPRVLQWQDAEGEWHDVTEEEIEDGS